MHRLIYTIAKVLLATGMYWLAATYLGYSPQGWRMVWLGAAYSVISFFSIYLIILFLDSQYGSEESDRIFERYFRKYTINTSLLLASSGLVSAIIVGLPGPWMAFVSFGTIAFLPSFAPRKKGQAE